MKVRLLICFLVSFVFASGALNAQTGEVNLYGGYYWPGDNTSGVGKFMSTHILGVRGGGFISESVEVGGNYAWSNHFQPSSSNVNAAFAGALGFPQGKVRSHLWEMEFAYNFGRRNVLGAAVRPYLVVGGGGLLTSIRDGDVFVLNVRSVATPTGTDFVANDVMEEDDIFFTFSYGGGVKAMRLWGPVGLFADFRGRTTPNFFGHGMTWPELSAGLNFSWGD
jgi:hypothetical protein